MGTDTTVSPVISDSPHNATRRTILLLVGAGALAGNLASLVEPEPTEAKKKKGKKKGKGSKGKGKGKKRCTGRVSGGASASEEIELLTLINQFRNDQQPPLPPYTRNLQLNSAALLHSQDMARRCYFDHISPEGTDPFDRMDAAGYTGTPLSENIYVGTGPFKSAAEAFDAWRTSTSGHREAMLDPEAIEIGIGTALDGSGAMYWTNVFGISEN